MKNYILAAAMALSLTMTSTAPAHATAVSKSGGNEIVALLLTGLIGMMLSSGGGVSVSTKGGSAPDLGPEKGDILMKF